MAVGLDITWAVDWTRRSAEVVTEHRAELTGLDREIGDGDHGENLHRGFTAVIGKLDDLPAGSTPGDVFKLVATTLISTVGGAAGPLYGTAYLRAATAAGSDVSLDGPKVAEVLAAARDGIVARGRAVVGDKTMVDAWTPAVDAAAEAGAVATEPLIAHKGRASYLGERAIGHRDPGAESTALLLRAAADTADVAAGA